MKKILIIEDEIPARKKLRRFVEELNTPTEIVAELDTVQAAIHFLNNHHPDVIFSDIELLDGNAFEIYQQVSVRCPIIFTTAYDQFWMQAFDSNGIAYLLKPFSKDRFQKAWDKYQLLEKSGTENPSSIDQLTALMQQHLPKPYKRRFSIHSQQETYFLETENILFFQAHEGVVFAYDINRKKHILTESTLKEIEEQLSPLHFFRINRSELIHKPYIEKIERHNKNTFAIKIKGFDTYLVNSQSNTAVFREWIEQ